jgi:hypothetical protein
MIYAATLESPVRSAPAPKPFIASYDLGYEYSQERYIALQGMVEDADEELECTPVRHLDEVLA